MLVGIFSDSHLGFGSDDRFEEAFARFKESIDLFKEKKVDLILHAGDLFDEATPNQEVWLKTFDCFAHNNGSLVSYKVNTLSGQRVVFCKGIPVVAIHGTHEHRGKDFANALDVLEQSNCLIHLHASNIVFEKNNEKLVIHGMGGVPEKHAKEVLEKYSPKPFPNSTNVLLLHQSFTEFLPFAEDDNVATLSLGDLPSGFDLIIDGHLHWTDEQKIDGKRFLLTGSSIFTQMKNLESQKKKGSFLFDTSTKKLDFVPFPVQRELFYHKISFTDAKPQEVSEKVSTILSELFKKSFAIKPLVRIKLSGSLAKGFTQSDVVLDVSKLSDKAIFSVSKDLSSESFQKKIESLRNIQDQKKSIADIGVDLLEKNVDEAGLKGFDTRRMFDLLSAGENDAAEKVLLTSAE